MKQFLMAVIAWIKVHVWQSVVIGVAAAGVIATSITLPIVLSKEEAPQQEPTVTNPNPNPDPTPGPGPAPMPVYYTVTVSDYDFNHAEKVTLIAGGNEITSGSQVLEHTEVTVLVTYINEGYLVSLTKNGVEVPEPEIPYIFTVESNTTLEFVFDGASPSPGVEN